MIKNKFNINKLIEDNLNTQEQLSPEEEQLNVVNMVERINQIDSEKAYTKVAKRIQERPKSFNLMQQLTRIAAVLFVPALFLSIWFYLQNSNTDNQPTQYTVNCPVGIKTQLELPDGSKVWLNSGTTIKYNLPFTTKTRKVELNGEAYFSVEKDKVPFIVSAENTAIQVYGTEFNVKSYTSDKQIEVALQEGSIGFRIENQEQTSRLKPNDYLVFDKTTNRISTINKNISKHVAWRQNLLVFDETPLAEMALTLERWYGIEVEIKQNDLMKYKFTATFENESLLQVIELLELSSPIKIDYQPTKLDKHSNIISKAKIIIHKET